MSQRTMSHRRRWAHWHQKLFPSIWRSSKILHEIIMDFWQMEKYEREISLQFEWNFHSEFSSSPPPRNQLSWADFYFAGIIDYLNYLAKTDLTADFGNLRRVCDNVTCQDGVQNWINNRPNTEIWLSEINKKNFFHNTLALSGSRHFLHFYNAEIFPLNWEKKLHSLLN